MTTFLKKDGGLVGIGGKLVKKVTPTTPHMPRYMEIMKDADGNNLVDESGNVIVTRKFYVYSDDTVQSMLTPQPYAAGTYPYGFCVVALGDLEIPTTGWTASGHSNHTYFLSGWAAANGIGSRPVIQTIHTS